MKDDRFKEIMTDLGMPNSSSLLTALKQVANEVAQESLNRKEFCKICHGTGWNHGAQDWSEKFVRKHGGPYYSVRCGCGD